MTEALDTSRISAALSATLSARVSTNVSAVRREIAAACARAGRDPAGVRLIAVTKNQDPGVLAALAAAGVSDIGENRLEHQLGMHDPATALGLRIHAIGRIQGRQLAKVIPLSDCLHSLCDPEHLARLVHACAGRTTPFPVFIQVNTSGEEAKAGIAPNQLSSLLAAIRGEPALEAVGLMTMAPEGADEAVLRGTFSRLRELAADHRLPRLSMGMSQDFAIAIEEGATDVRIGTRLFA